MKQSVTYWAPSSRDAYGKITFAAPIAVTARWEERQELFRDARGEEIMSKARVYCASAVALDGYLFNGTSVATDPTSVLGAFQIRNVGLQPDLRNLHQLNVAML